MKSLSGLIAGSVVIVFSIGFICFGLMNSHGIDFSVLFSGGTFLIVGLFIIFKEKEDKIEKIKDEIIKNMSKEAQKKEELREKNVSLVTDYCSRYLSSKDDDFKRAVMLIYNTCERLCPINENQIDILKKHYISIITDKESNADYDELMQIELDRRNVLQFIEDVKKIKKILDKKEIKTDYIQIFKEMIKIVKQELEEGIKEKSYAIYKLIQERLSKIATIDKKTIIKEHLKVAIEKCWFDDLNDEARFIARKTPIPYLFDNFGLEYSNSEIEPLLKNCIEEMELEDFENNLGIESKKKIGDFSKLNGHQFEDYLKELFSILGYQVMRTKLSGDQGADLIIKKDNIKTVVQAKKYTGTVNNRAIQEVVASKKHYGADNAMVVTTGTFTKSAIELAKSNKVDIWDKNKLKETIYNINKA